MTLWINWDILECSNLRVKVFFLSVAQPKFHIIFNKHLSNTIIYLLLIVVGLGLSMLEQQEKNCLSWGDMLNKD